MLFWKFLSCSIFISGQHLIVVLFYFSMPCFAVFYLAWCCWENHRSLITLTCLSLSGIGCHCSFFLGPPLLEHQCHFSGNCLLEIWHDAVKKYVLRSYGNCIAAEMLRSLYQKYPFWGPGTTSRFVCRVYTSFFCGLASGRDPQEIANVQPHPAASEITSTMT